MLTRRALIGTAAACAWAADKQVQTVLGPVPASSLGRTLIHEHVMVDFIGADQASPSRYDADEVFRTALPKLQELREAGCQTLAECTPAYLARDPALLAKLARASGLHILTNTGYYGAANDKFVPAHALAETAESIASRWTAEFRKGIGKTGIKPAFMKIGVDAGPLAGVDRKLIEAACICHRDTGLRMHVHTGNGQAATDIVALLGERKIPPSSYIWVHAQSEKDREIHLKLARAGCWVEFDGVSEASLTVHVEAVMDLSRAGLLNRVLVSQDSGWYRVGEPGGGTFNGYTFLFQRFLPALRTAGLSENQVDRLMTGNPAAVLTS